MLAATPIVVIKPNIEEVDENEYQLVVCEKTSIGYLYSAFLQEIEETPMIKHVIRPVREFYADVESTVKVLFAFTTIVV